MIENKYIVPVFAVILLFGFLFVFDYFYSNVNQLYDSYSLTSSNDFWTNNKLRLHANESLALKNTVFPKEVHQMWKSNSLPPKETMRWRSACQALNPYHDFNMMDDRDLQELVHEHYPQYSSLFNALKGVYMADMARFVVAYHFGGIYLDLDFYCHRPLFCLEQFVLSQISKLTKTPFSEDKQRLADILVVSREPILHAHLIHHSPRVVIQDFLMATPRHPFLKWLLDSRVAAFEKDPAVAKSGPFSYHIDEALDEYYREQKATTVYDVWNSSSLSWVPSLPTSSSPPSSTTPSPPADLPPNAFSFGTPATSSAGVSTSFSIGASVVDASPPEAQSMRKAYVLELQAEILHPLVDATNSRIATGCKDVLKKHSTESPLFKRCVTWEREQYLEAVPDTVMVHMWTHTFLGWSALRGLYNSGTYATVEKMLPPVAHCRVQDR